MPRNRASETESAYREALKGGRIIADPSQMEALHALARLESDLSKRRAFWTRRSVRGVYLYGPVGRGKTWLMDLFFDNLAVSRKIRRHFHAFMREDVHAPLTALQGQRDPLAKLAHALSHKARVICFDELLVEDITDAMLLGPLFQALFAEGVALVATANTAPHGLYRDGLQRRRFLPAIAAIERHCEVVGVAGSRDHRAEHIGAQGVWRVAGQSSRPERLAELFYRLTGEAARPCEVTINGRPVRCLGASGNALFAAFESLCDGPRSADDYLELARRYRSLLLLGVPPLNDDNLNAVRRFIALIDVLYEAHTVLIASAASAPGEIYSGKRFRFEFRRTASRLEEMRSAGWLAAAHLSRARILTPL